eukprot:SAG31_NODE_217_length_19988_cov_53.300820_11_plen_68_part_00
MEVEGPCAVLQCGAPAVSQNARDYNLEEYTAFLCPALDTGKQYSRTTILKMRADVYPFVYCTCITGL